MACDKPCQYNVGFNDTDHPTNFATVSVTVVG